MQSFRRVRWGLGAPSVTAAVLLALCLPRVGAAATTEFSMFSWGEESRAFEAAGMRVLGLQRDLETDWNPAGSGSADGVAAGSVLDFGPEETPSELRPFYGRLGNDVRDLVRMPLSMNRRQWARFGGAVLVVGAVSLLDEEVRNSARDGGAGPQELASSLRPLGQEAGLAFLGASWLAGRAFDRPGLSAMAQDGVEATLLSAGLITPLLKGAVGRSRPRHNLGSRSFSGSESFPSGEVTEAFAIASVVAAHSERKWVKALSWSLASLVAWQRVELDGHWASDVVAGAFIGAGTGRWVVRRNRPELRERRRWAMAPQVGKGTYGLGFRIALGSRPPRSSE